MPRTVMDAIDGFHELTPVLSRHFFSRTSGRRKNTTIKHLSEQRQPDQWRCWWMS